MATTFAKPINNIATTVAAPYAAGSGSLAVASAAGIALAPGQWVRVSTSRAGAPLSILRATGVSGDVLAIAGGADGSSDVDLQVGDAAELRVTAGAFADLHAAVNALELAAAPYVFAQPTPASSWTIAHQLNRYPSVTVVDSAGEVVIGDIRYVDANTITAAFSGGFSGSAYLN